MTADELFDLPPDRLRHALVRGELATMPPPGGEHGVWTFNIAVVLGNFLESNKVGVGVRAETGFLIGRNPDTVLAPDCAFVRADRVPPAKDRKKFWPIAPDLAVEVLSPL
jgi:Uma2 family endonuclease